MDKIRPAPIGILGGTFPSGNLQQSYIYPIHGVKEWTFLDMLLGTFRNENNVLNTFISVCNIC